MVVTFQNIFILIMENEHPLLLALTIFFIVMNYSAFLDLFSYTKYEPLKNCNYHDTCKISAINVWTKKQDKISTKSE